VKGLHFNWTVAKDKERYTYVDLIMVGGILALWSVNIWLVLIGTGWA